MKSSAVLFFFLLAAFLYLSGAFYFIGLVAGLPWWLMLFLTAALLYFLHHRYYAGLFPGQERIHWLSCLILFVCLSAVAWQAVALSPKYGTWDAIAMWNYHGRLLAEHGQYKNIFRSVYCDHSDYPLELSAFLASVSRLTGGFHWMIPVTVHLAITMMVTGWVFTALAPRNIIIAAIACAALAADGFFISQGVSQCADTLLALYLLGALIAADLAKENPKWMLFMALMLGGAMWTKNEGLILTGIILTGYGRTLFLRPACKKYFLPAFLCSVFFIAWFKIIFAPMNDMLEHQNGQIADFITDGSRYQLIWTYLKTNTQACFVPAFCAIILYLLCCAWMRKMPGLQFFILLGCLLAYLAIYVITPYDLDWHLRTSQQRLLHQLAPSFIYIAGYFISGQLKRQVFSSDIAKAN